MQSLGQKTELFTLRNKMKLNVLKQDGSKGAALTVDDSVFGITPNESVVHQAVVAELANGRQGTHASKTALRFVVAVESPGNKKAVVLPVPVQFVLPFGRVVVLCLVQSPMTMIRSYRRKCVDWPDDLYCQIAPVVAN